MSDKKMNFTKLQTLMIQKAQIEREITAARVKQLRLLRTQIVNKKLLEKADQVERMVSSVNYCQTELDDLLSVIEAALDLDLS